MNVPWLQASHLIEWLSMVSSIRALRARHRSQLMSPAWAAGKTRLGSPSFSTHKALLGFHRFVHLSSSSSAAGHRLLV